MGFIVKTNERLRTDRSHSARFLLHGKPMNFQILTTALSFAYIARLYTDERCFVQKAFSLLLAFSLKCDVFLENDITLRRRIEQRGADSKQMVSPVPSHIYHTWVVVTACRGFEFSGWRHFDG